MAKDNIKDKRINSMEKSWNNEGKAYSNIHHDDSLFFSRIEVPIGKIGITSQTGSDLIYYDPKIYTDDTNAIRCNKIK